MRKETIVTTCKRFAGLLAVWFFSWLIVFKGVQKGVERANKIFMPLLLGLIVILVIWSLSLKGAMSGIAVYLKPDFSQLSNHQIWLDAFSQIFFTLSLAFGIITKTEKQNFTDGRTDFTFTGFQ